MNINGKLDVDFKNFEHERHLNEDLDVSSYQRVKNVWNIYFHGFMDRHCDIAYVLKPTSIEPGIYEITVYGEPAYLFLWEPNDSDKRYKGLITQQSNASLTEDAFTKYTANRAFI